MHCFPNTGLQQVFYLNSIPALSEGFKSYQRVLRFTGMMLIHHSGANAELRSSRTCEEKEFLIYSVLVHGNKKQKKWLPDGASLSAAFVGRGFFRRVQRRLL